MLIYCSYCRFALIVVLTIANKEHFYFQTNCKEFQDNELGSKILGVISKYIY